MPRHIWDDEDDDDLTFPPGRQVCPICYLLGLAWALLVVGALIYGVLDLRQGHPLTKTGIERGDP